ncbi:hypothetical protein VMCG_03763 [Cytospora schulzeri]|uniref:ubiquitinyl hydrolase 1 n=1 Tax=Cytospora schulzeri TaxID=448051 RepID=A0A423WUU7_9PEZI|nr:hypothetical protein VMCG_03763 [Valsa malicola]
MSLLEGVFNHLVLPPKLPGRQDPHLEDESQDFVKRLIKAIDTLSIAATNTHMVDALVSVRQSLRLCSVLNRGRLDKDALIAAFQKFGKEQLILHVIEQNAAILIRRDGVGAVVFEAFEASATSEQVLASENALRWDFPGRACEVSETRFLDEDFQDNLAEFLEKASMDTLSRLVAHTRKANVDISEARDVTDPALITQMLMPLLDTLGSPIQVPKLRKRVRDDVNIDFDSGKGAIQPFRRHPFWLVLRVAVERQLCLSLGDIKGRACYKFIVCIVLAHLLQDVVGKLRPELTLVLRAKLSRRLAKLEQERSQQLDTSIYDCLFNSTGPWFRTVIESVTERINLVWTDFKSKTTRKLERLPSYAPPSDLRLSLPSSGTHLNDLLQLRPVQQTQVATLQSLLINDEGIKQVQEFTRRYFDLAEVERSIEKDATRLVNDEASHDQPMDRCVELAEYICEYFEKVGTDSYASNPELMSTFVLNVFDLWVLMDIVALRACPLLRDYHPVFTPQLLDCLQLPNARDFARLQAIQQHLHQRIDRCRFKSYDVFTGFESADSFASKYVAESTALQVLRRQIEMASDDAQEEKEEEWQEALEECEELSQNIAELACICTFAGEDGKRTQEDIMSCKQCYFWRKRNRLEIKVHEDFLPSHNSRKSSIVFELAIPREIEAYRNVTFRIIRDLAWPSEVTKTTPPLLLENFSQLQPYKKPKCVTGGITLASPAKSFLQTHWEDLKVRRSSLRDVVLPHGPHFELFDAGHSIWVNDIDREALTLQHLCGIVFPKCLDENILPPSPHPPAVVGGPSSYAVVANQRECPQHMSLHEFSAYQHLLSGISRRWINILVELGSSNLNFSNNDTVQLLSQLAVQAGPATTGHRLRESYMVFDDDAFCHRLATMVQHKLDGIRSNWREVNCMDLCITLAQRLRSFTTSGTVRYKADNLINCARKTTLSWISRLREEVGGAKDSTTAERAAGYAFKGALLCRRTFALTSTLLDAQELQTYCEASVALQENMIASFETDPSLRAMLIKDTKMAWGLQKFVKESIIAHPQSLEAAISNSWSTSDSTKTKFTSWTALDGQGQWVAAHIFTTFTTHGHSFSPKQTVHFNILEGFLLVDGKPLGKLPLKISQSDVVRELFSTTHLRTYPSMQSGMSHRLASLIEGNEVHFGLRNEEVVIRTVSSCGTLEFIPRNVFNKNGISDLPVNLLENCTHWLNVSTCCLEVRRKPKIWKSRPRNWIIDLRQHECRRGTGKVSRLVDPHSPTARRVAKVFEHFEQPDHLTIYQPTTKKITVDVSRFELSFEVNRNCRLEERKLGKEIDEDQDAGCLYGLLSKLVLRDIENRTKRSVIVPLGGCLYRLRGMHVEVTVDSSSAIAYASFEIDEALGRLTCPAEPALVYAKAHFHALTSFPIPDPLTGRTGTEEAVQILESGVAQPWNPLGFAAIRRLSWIASLSPAREFYPKDKRRLQNVSWNPSLSVTVQHERFETLARNLLRKSHRLQPFVRNTLEVEEVEPPSHLRSRGEIHRSLYEPHTLHPVRVQPSGLDSTLDRGHDSRDLNMNSEVALNVVQIAQTVFRRPFHLRGKRALQDILHGHRFIGGFQQDNAPPAALSKLIDDDVIDQFGHLIDFSRNLEPMRLFSLAFRLCLLAFQPQADLEILEVLAAFARIDALKVVVPPPHAVFIDFDVAQPTVDLFEKLIRPLWPEFEPRTHRKIQDARDRHVFRCEEDGRRLAQWFVRQWPAAELSVEEFYPGTQLVDEAEALEAVLPTWQRMMHNLELSHYLEEVQPILDRYVIEDDAAIHATSSIPCTIYFASVTRTGSVIPSLSSELLTKCVPKAIESDLFPPPSQLVHKRNVPGPVNVVPWEQLAELEQVLNTFAESTDGLRRQYGNDLKKSLQAMKQGSANSSNHVLVLGERYRSNTHVSAVIEQARMALMYLEQRITDALAQGDRRAVWLRLGNLWPCATRVTLLEQLRSSARVTFGAGMKEAVVQYGVMITEMQWLQRVSHALLTGNTVRLQEALENTGHQSWDPMDFPDWLLVELDGDLLIRPGQIDVAKAIISPPSGANSVLQMNMGQGKTSCIVPMAMAVLGSNQNQIARLVVPKALLLQTAQVVQSRIGGLVGREIRHVPFSRRTPSSIEQLRLYSELHKEIRRDCGVMLTTSDHLLSYKLSGLQRLVDSKTEEARFMIGFQDELTKYSRDVIDESDFTLAVKTQLIYPSGPRIHVDGAPQRWIVAQALISLIEDHLPALQSRGVEIVRLHKAQGSFPMVHFLKQEAEEELHRRIVDDICNGRAPFLRPAESGAPPKELREHIRQLLSEASTKKQDKDGLKQSIGLFADQESAPKILLLVRGLLLNRILLLCLKKRYNVQYGLHPGRDPIAVPYEAKGVPSETSEFGHPDVAIILTILSFYYGGVNQAQFRQSLGHILKSDDPAAEFDRWTNGCDSLPASLRTWSVINIDDAGQIDELWLHLRLDREVLNHFMNNFVFPAHAKQSTVKLSASAWDIPGLPKPHKSNLSGARTSGFSGTKDNEMLLPMTIRQNDLPSLVHTNAEVLSSLLQDRNRGYYLAADDRQRLTEEQLLDVLCSKRIKILIDAGAYILESSNLALVKKWLEMDKVSKAAVFFAADNRAWVLYRGAKDKTVPLVTTPFANNLSECLVFLDEAHCRGTDLKLPQRARGALTLALGQTKDHTVQAAMRLRQLATTQSVEFFAPPEVDQSIRDVCMLRSQTRINSAHVITWLLEQTCRANEQLTNLHLAQGVDYCRRMDGQWSNSKFLTDDVHRMKLLNVIQQSERQNLEQQYGPIMDASTRGSADEVSYSELKGFMSKLTTQRRAMVQKANGQGMHSSALEEVEQQREVEVEVEEVRHVQKHKRYGALKFPSLHPTIDTFVRTGRLVGNEGYVHAFDSLQNTTIGQKYDVGGTGSRFFVSQEFTRTVVLRKEKADNFLRPVEWILWSPSTKTALVIIPEEVELLIPLIRRAGHTSQVHLITYAAPVTKAMLKNFNGLRYYSLPTLPIGYQFPDWFLIELGIFAGRLYVTHEECSLIARYLHISETDDGDAVESVVGRTFARNPVGFLCEWLPLRRQVSDVMQTPMGYIIQGRLHALRPDHAFFVTRVADAPGIMDIPVSNGSTDDTSDEDEDEFSDGGEDIDDGWEDLGEENFGKKVSDDGDDGM